MDTHVSSPLAPAADQSPTARLNVALIGAGKMGLPIAGHLHRGGHRVVVFDASTERKALARTNGLMLAESVDAAVASADIVLSSLPHDVAFEAVASDVATCVRAGQIYIDTSTVSLAASQRIARVFEEAQVDYLRVPVSGNPPMVEHRQLTAIGSGPHDAWRRVLPLLKLLGDAQFYVGEHDEARVMKLVINLMVANTAAMLAEALVLGQKGGLDWADMWDVIVASAVGSPVVRAKAEQLRHRDFTPTFTVTQMQKDVGLILDAGASLNVPLQQTGNVAVLLRQAAELGLEGEDFAAIVKVVGQSAGLPLHG